MLILPDFFPVPDVKGGGVELLITQLLNQNEENNKMKLVVVSKYDKKAAETHYYHSNIYYFDNKEIVNRPIKNIQNRWKNYCTKQKIKRKVFHNRFTNRLFKNVTASLDYFLFQCLLIAKQEHTDTLIIENLIITDKFKPLVKYFGKKKSLV